MTPPGITIDLLDDWKTANNFSLNLPDIVIWRLHIKISIHYTLSPTTVLANDGMFVAVFVDNILGSAGLNFQTTELYGESFMVWDKIYVSDFLASAGNSSSSGTLLYASYDVKSRRKLMNQNETLLLNLSPTGNLTLGSTDAINLTMSCLLKLGRR